LKATRSTIHGLMTASVIIVVAGCARAAGGSAIPSVEVPTTASPATTSPSATVTATATASAGDAWLLVGRRDSEELTVILDSTLEEQIAVPLGVPGERWGNVFTATPTASTTVVKDVVIQPGYGGDGRTIDGRWVFPTIGEDPVPVGVSADGSTLVLVEADVAHGRGGADRTTSRFAVLDAYLVSGDDPRVIELAGAFDFDALSPDGSLLYVAQQIPGPLEGRYQVRVVETETGRLRPDVIVDKRNVNEQMAGYAIDQERRADGIVLTLYRGAEHPFVHALSTVDAWAVCIDLPKRGFDDVDAASDWGIVPLGAADVAVNATLGVAVDIDPAALNIRRAVDFEPSAAAAFRLAKFGHGDLGPAGRRVAAAPDGTGVYAAGEGGIVRLGIEDLDVEQRYLTGTAVDAIAVTADGESIFALTGGRIARLDAETGALERWVGEGGFDRLLGALPW
jgi:hypothetical protein